MSVQSEIFINSTNRSFCTKLTAELFICNHKIAPCLPRVLKVDQAVKGARLGGGSVMKADHCVEIVYDLVSSVAGNATSRITSKSQLGWLRLNIFEDETIRTDYALNTTINRILPSQRSLQKPVSIRPHRDLAYTFSTFSASTYRC